MGRPRKARAEGALTKITAPPVEEIARDHDGNEIKFDEPRHLARDFNAAIAYFKECFPEDWEDLARCPLMHGVEIIAHKLAGKA